MDDIDTLPIIIPIDKDQLMELWKEGKTFSQIAFILKCTRNVVAGQITRLRNRGNPLARKETEEVKVQRNLKRRLARANKTIRRKVKGYVSEVKTPPNPMQVVEGLFDKVTAAPDTMNWTDLIDLNDRSCTWPTNHGFCGNLKMPSYTKKFDGRIRTIRSSYCEHHHLLSIAPPREKRHARTC